MNRTAKSSGGGTLLVAPRRDLCLDFANTLSYRGGDAQESLHDFGELVRWCAAMALLSADGCERALRWSDQHPEQALAVFAEAIAIREASYRIFFAIAAHRIAEPRAVAAVNRALAAAPARQVLVRGHKGFGWQIARDGFSAPALLAPVLWSAGDLMVSPDTIRLRHCSNEQCLWLFLDDSKNGSRRWCSMQACGNRAKAHRHYLRTRTA
jgi:predicted RNA-binding Zn ribbon-like protein